MKAEDSAALLITAICVLWHLPSTSYRAMPLPLLWQAEQLPFPQPKITAATTGNKSSAVAPAALASWGDGRLSFKPAAIGPLKSKHPPLLAQLLSCPGTGTDTCPPASFPLPALAALGKHRSNICLLEIRKKEQSGWSTRMTESGSQGFSGTPTIFTTWALRFHVVECSHEIQTPTGSSGPAVRT